MIGECGEVCYELLWVGVGNWFVVCVEECVECDVVVVDCFFEEFVDCGGCVVCGVD